MKKTKKQIAQEALEQEKLEINDAIAKGFAKELLFLKIEKLAERYSDSLRSKIDERKEEMKLDDNSHYLVYRVLGIATKEGEDIDVFQNAGRFLYKYAGSFLEEAASLCLKFKNVEGGKKLIDNNQGTKPKTFEIDFLDNKNAIEIKWRDATTDGDHITKEHTRVKCISSYDYVPVRVMFYYPQRAQAKKVQETLKSIYKSFTGEYYGGEEAWDYIKKYSGYDLKEILTLIANKRLPGHGD
ncbi:MAG: ApaLI family restriction endonuclease [Flavobacterium johnsoniae]|nr:MAG: ApaLI family restriction endonuclease [Flavobacterium johnsoniae]